MQVWTDYLAGNKQRFLDELLDLLRIPSISADSKHKGDVARCAEAVKESLLKAINKLTPRQKEVLTLRFYDALSYEEIDALMMLPVKSVYMLVYRAIDALKQNINLGLRLIVLSILATQVA